MSENERIISIIPAPAGLSATYRPSTDDTEEVFKEPVAAFALVEEKDRGTTSRHAVALVVDTELGILEPVDSSSNFDRLEWQAIDGTCSKT